MIKVEDIVNDGEVKAIMFMAESQIEALGFTEHSVRHSTIVSRWAGQILHDIGKDEHRVELAKIAGYLHDIGNSVNRYNHAQSGAILAYKILTRLGMEYEDAAAIMMAIGNHDESEGLPVSDITAALILADKADVHKSRVRNNTTRVNLDNLNIHDRYNHAQSGAILAYKILTRLGMEYEDAAAIMMAIGNHDESEGLPVSDITAALILADKADVHKSRVRNNTTRVNLDNLNIHDRVNLAAEKSSVYVEKESNKIILDITIDTDKCPVMSYFEIYFKRMQLCRRAAEFLGREFSLMINGVRLL